jgi:hypothetical protein
MTSVSWTERYASKACAACAEVSHFHFHFRGITCLEQLQRTGERPFQRSCTLTLCDVRLDIGFDITREVMVLSCFLLRCFALTLF